MSQKQKRRPTMGGALSGWQHPLPLLCSVFAGLLQASCATQEQRTAISDAITAACTDIAPVLVVAGVVPAAGTIAAGVQVGCFTAEGISRLAADPASAIWIGQQKQILVDLAHKAGVQI